MAINASFGPTVLATSTPLNLCDGFPLFGSGTARAGLTSASNSANLLNNPPYVINGFSLAGTFGGSLFVGLCGPSYATTLTLDAGQLSAGNVSFMVPTDDTQAGLVFGCSLSLNLDFTLGVWEFNQEAESYPLSFSLTFDVLQLLINILLNYIDNSRLTQLDNILPQLGSTWGLFDEGSNAYEGGGPLVLNPSLALQVNAEPLLELIPDVGEAVKAVNEVLASVGGGISFGPFFNVGLEIQFNLDSFGIGGFQPAPLTYLNTGLYQATLTTPSSAPADQATVVISHLFQQVDFGIGFYGQITVAEAFNLYGGIGPFPIGGIDINTAPQTHPLSTTVTFG